MKRKVCVRSMVLGAVIMLIGLAVGAIVSPPLIAQRVIVAQNREFDDVQCKRLTVVDENGNDAIVLESAKVSNIVAIHSKYGKGSVILSASHQLGSGIAIFNKPEEGGLLIGAYEGVGNQVQIHDKYRDGGGVFLGTGKEFKNSRISLRDVAGELKWEAP